MKFYIATLAKILTLLSPSNEHSVVEMVVLNPISQNNFPLWLSLGAIANGKSSNNHAPAAIPNCNGSVLVT